MRGRATTPSSAQGSIQGAYCFAGFKEESGGWQPLLEDRDQKPVEGHRALKIFEKEMDAAEQALQATRDQVARLGSCDVALYEDLQTIRQAAEQFAQKIRRAAEVLLERALAAKSRSAKQMSEIYASSIASGSSMLPSTRTQLRSASRLSQEPCAEHSREPDRAVIVTEDSQCFESLMDSTGSGVAGSAPWFDIVRQLPDVNLKDLCHSKVDLQDVLGKLELPEIPVVEPGPPPRSPTPASRSATPGPPRCVSRSRQVCTPPVGQPASPAALRLRLELELGDVMVAGGAVQDPQAATYITDLSFAPVKQVEFRLVQNDKFSCTSHRLPVVGSDVPLSSVRSIGSVVIEIADVPCTELALALLDGSSYADGVSPLRIPAAKLLEGIGPVSACGQHGYEALPTQLDFFLTWTSRSVLDENCDTGSMTYYYPFTMRISVVGGPHARTTSPTPFGPVAGTAVGGARVLKSCPGKRRSPTPEASSAICAGGSGPPPLEFHCTVRPSGRRHRPPRSVTPTNLAARMVARAPASAASMSAAAAFPPHWKESLVTSQARSRSFVNGQTPVRTLRNSSEGTPAASVGSVAGSAGDAGFVELNPGEGDAEKVDNFEFAKREAMTIRIQRAQRGSLARKKAGARRQPQRHPDRNCGA